MLVFNTEIVANELPEVNYYNSIDLIKNISNEYANNIETITKNRIIRDKLYNEKLKTNLAKKTVKRRKGAVKKQVAKKQNIDKEQPVVYEVNDCKNKNSSVLLRNGIESCFDVATDVPTYTRPINLNSEYLGLGVNSRPIDLGITPLDTSKIMLLGKNVNILDR
ncbi:MAG: hypothetical protein L3J51_00850 [Cocleimonas sp.]|nr:hypothetical protein [Cocleimonas sp.]